MAKDLRTMPSDKLWKRVHAALEELRARSTLGNEPVTEPGFRVSNETAAMMRQGSPEATLQRRLTRPHLPKPDPAYLAAFERTRPREPAQQPTDTEAPIYATAPGPSEPAE